MRKRLKVMKESAKRFRRLTLSIGLVVATASLAIGAVTVISRKNVNVKEESNNQEKRPVVVTPAANKSYVTVKVAGQDVQVDSQTGQIRELTPEEAAKLAAGLKEVINQSSDGLVQVQQKDGSVSMDLDGRFQNVTVARRNVDGTVSESCVDNPKSAGEFFGIDPQLIDSKVSKGEATQQRHPMTSVKNQNQ